MAGMMDMINQMQLYANQDKPIGNYLAGQAQEQQQQKRYQDMAQYLPMGGARQLAAGGYDPRLGYDMDRLAVERQEQERIAENQAYQRQLMDSVFNNGAALPMGSPPVQMGGGQPQATGAGIDPRPYYAANSQIPMLQGWGEAKIEEDKRNYERRKKDEERKWSASRESKPPTQAELDAAGFAGRMTSALNVFESLENIEGFDPTGGSVRSFVRAIPSAGLTTAAENMTATPNLQKYRQAAANWIRANLRKESGAAIGADEMESDYRTYFPVVGDTPEVIAQKAETRRKTTEAMLNSAGRAYQGDPLPKLNTDKEKKKTPSMAEVEAALRERGSL